MTALANIIAACQHSGKHIVLAEGEDQRVQQAAARAVHDQLAEITLLGEPDAIAAAYHARGEPIPQIDVLDPAYIPLDEDLVELYLSLRAHKGADRDAAIQAVRQPLIYSALMLRSGRADGSIAGAVHTTADVVRAAVQLVGASEAGGLVSSCFIVQLPPERHPQQRAFDIHRLRASGRAQLRAASGNSGGGHSVVPQFTKSRAESSDAVFFYLR